MEFDKKFLKTLTVLYAEDDEHARASMSAVLNKIFKKAFIAKDGKQGLEYFKRFHEQIDVVISDINMPHLNGIELLEEVRKISKDIPFIFTTAFQETEYLLEAVKNNVFYYAHKPVNIKEIILKVQEASMLEYEKKKAQHNYKEAQLYLSFINQIALISKTDLLGDIIFVNELFCEVSGYEKDELIGQPHSIIRHPDTSKEVFEEMWTTIRKGDTWRGKLKNKDADGNPYYINITIFPIYDETDSEIEGFMSIGFLTTDEENEKREYKTQLRQMLIEHKKIESELKKQVKELEKKLYDCENIDLLQANSKKATEQNKKLIKQLHYYEEQLKLAKQEKHEIQKVAKERFLAIMKENKEFKFQNDVMKKEIAHLKSLTEAQEREIYKLNTQVNQQAEVITNLKDVIEHREEQLEKLGYKVDIN